LIMLQTADHMFYVLLASKTRYLFVM